MENNHNVLIRIGNLKQWFPLKKKGAYVKANDGITLDIYEGETFGLVGESGCGKSTLGRTILQFYRQTDGRTIYYGQSAEEFAPGYVKKTIRNLEKLRARYREREKTYRELFEAYQKLGEEEKYRGKEKLDQAEKESRDAFLDMAGVVGGLMLAPDLKPVQEIYLKKYEISEKLKETRENQRKAELALADLTYKVQEKKEDGKDVSSLKAKVDEASAKVKKAGTDAEGLKKQLLEINGQIEEMKRLYASEDGFQKAEACLEDGIDLARLSYNEIRLLRSDLQLIFQDPYSSLNPRMTVGQIIGEGMLAHGMFRKNDGRMQREVLRVMEECGLAPYFLHRFPHQFSGGQRQRIGIARSLAVKPRFVVCDEAVSALDVSIQSQIINLLQDLKERQNLTYLFITHDLSVVKYISDRIGVMYLGVMVELAGAQDIFAHPYHPYTEALLAAIPTTDVGDSKKELKILEGDIPSPVNPPKGCKFHTRCQYCTKICEHVVPDWEEVAPGHFVACHHKLG